MTMSSLKLVLIFGAALCLYPLNARDTNLFWAPNNTNNNIDEPIISAANTKPGYDYFLLALQLPAAFCKLQQAEQRKCNPDPPLSKHQNKFTIHGLWPQLNNANPPLDCSPATTMQDADFEAFEQDLLDYWPDLFSAQNFQSSKVFWKMEWNKHGTCSSNEFNRQQYLRITIDLAKKNAKGIFDGLINRGIIKKDGSTLRGKADIQKAVESITGHKNPIAIIVQRLLLEIRLCVNQDGKALSDCN
ncbi:ribonuclease S-7-like [Neltuma alba]|uniref:ribonuclease S-7-like n=1 Tax=Neltuma alba TaxID=207710 RepID=UPI0010A44E35|nr:ribonuclease S-7-like [Prosopis alba]